jgi:hypothetical protein
MTITDSLDAFTQGTIDKLRANVALLTSSDGLASIVDAEQAAGVPLIFYGDQEKFPATPCICVDPVTRTRDLQGVSFRTDNNFTVYVLVYHGRVQDNQLTRKQAQQIAEAVETLLNNDSQLGGLTINAWCSNNESGYVFRQGTMWRTNRVTFSGYTKTRLR